MPTELKADAKSQIQLTDEPFNSAFCTIVYIVMYKLKRASRSIMPSSNMAFIWQWMTTRSLTLSRVGVGGLAHTGPDHFSRKKSGPGPLPHCNCQSAADTRTATDWTQGQNLLEPQTKDQSPHNGAITATNQSQESSPPSLRKLVTGNLMMSLSSLLNPAPSPVSTRCLT